MQKTPLASRIERDINFGALAPAAWLKQIDLQKRYGCSRLELRQALDQLVLKRLICHVPNRGYHVDEFGPRKIYELTKARAVLEVAATEEIAANVNAQALPELRRLAREFAAATVRGTLGEQDEANKRFHAELLKLCSNRELAALIIELRARLPVVVQRSWNTRERMEKSARDHFRMIDALKARDRELLKKITWEHVVVDDGSDVKGSSISAYDFPNPGLQNT